ncbi:MAG: hypothetical protein ACREMQ_24155, partial [Longimicrobiales bacterium]
MTTQAAASTRVLLRRSLIRGFESGLKRRNTFRYWEELERSQWWSPEELEQVQLAMLRRLLQHAYDHSPYYRECWQKLGLEPATVRALTDFARWPVIRREDIREHRMRMRSAIPGA